MIELIGTLTGAWDVWLCAREHIWNWPVGLVNCICFLIIFIQTGLYGSAGMQVFYIGLGIWGWWQWLYGGTNRTERVIRKLNINELWWLSLLSIVFGYVLYAIFIRVNDPAPLMDAVTTILSLAATYMLALKIEENWWCWIAADIIFIIMYFTTGLTLIAGLYVAFLIICIYGVIDWKRKRNQAEFETAWGHIWEHLMT